MAVAVGTLPCANCGGPTCAEAPPPDAPAWLGLIGVVCASCRCEAEREELAREAVERGARLAMAFEKRLDRVGVPPHLRGYLFRDIDMPEGLTRALELASKWASGELQGLGLVGPVGVGKTRVGAAAANQACMRLQTHWYSATLLVARLGSGTFDSPERQKALEVLLGTAPLVLDDLDKARPTEYATEVLFQAVDARADGAGQLLVTTNWEGQDLVRGWPPRYAKPLVDRLKPLKWLRVSGESKRRRCVR